MPTFSVIIPVYNRIEEVDDLLDSLSQQSYNDFEVIIVEDGSTTPCDNVVAKYHEKIDVKYFYKENEGRSIARNYGIERAAGRYYIFFDSDCVIPLQYFKTLSEALDKNPLDCFGGPDSAHESFSDIQKAINYTMTSFLTTGGIRGGKVKLEKFVPRTFNMGFSKTVYDNVGGFREMFSEDIDMSMRIRKAGFSIDLIREAFVYHKRRVDFKKFLRQVYVFGMSRITLYLLYPDSLKLVHLLPAVAVLGCTILTILSVCHTVWWLLPIAIYFVAIFIVASISTRSIKIALLSVPASIIQLGGYGCGFIKSFVNKIILSKGRDINEEIAMRKGK